MSRLTRDETAETVSRPKFSGANGVREMSIFSVQLTTSRIGNLTRLILTLALYVLTRFIAYPERRENHGTMILYGVSYSAYTVRYGSYCRYEIASSSQALIDLLRYLMRCAP